MLSDVVGFPSFLRMTVIPLYVFTTFPSFIKVHYGFLRNFSNDFHGQNQELEYFIPSLSSHGGAHGVWYVIVT